MIDGIGVRSTDYVFDRPDSSYVDTSAVVGHIDERIIGRPAIGRIGRKVYIGPHAIVCAGSTIGNDVYIEGRCYVRQRAVVGDRTRLFFGAYIGKRAEIGADCKIGGFVCNSAIVAPGSAILGSLVHRYGTPNIRENELSPTVGRNVMIGMGAVVVGPVHVGDGAIVGANCTVLANVPPGLRVTGTYRG